jgi:hypothetical protein
VVTEFFSNNDSTFFRKEIENHATLGICFWFFSVAIFPAEVFVMLIVQSGVEWQLAAVFHTVAFVQDRDNINKSSKHNNKNKYLHGTCALNTRQHDNQTI